MSGKHLRSELCKTEFNLHVILHVFLHDGIRHKTREYDNEAFGNGSLFLDFSSGFVYTVGKKKYVRERK